MSPTDKAPPAVPSVTMPPGAAGNAPKLSEPRVMIAPCKLIVPPPEVLACTVPEGLPLSSGAVVVMVPAGELLIAAVAFSLTEPPKVLMPLFKLMEVVVRSTPDPAVVLTGPPKLVVPEPLSCCKLAAENVAAMTSPALDMVTAPNGVRPTVPAKVIFPMPALRPRVSVPGALPFKSPLKVIAAPTLLPELVVSRLVG